MKFEEVLPALRAGKKVRRKCWSAGLLPTNDILADDWEIVKEKVKKTVWVNMYLIENMITGIGTYNTKDEAESKNQTLHSWLGAHPVTVEVDDDV